MKYRFSFATTLLVVVGFSCLAFAQTKPKIERVPAKDTAADSGSAMFSTYCAVCHGQDAKGDGPAASALKKQPANLTQLAKKNGGTYPAAKVSQMIGGDDVVAAHGSRDMPIWGKIFRNMEASPNASITKLRIHNLTEYIASLQEK